jgi:hypothetical protein
MAVFPVAASSIKSDNRFIVGFLFIIISFYAFFIPVEGPIFSTRILKKVFNNVINRETKENNLWTSSEFTLEAFSEKLGSRHTGTTSERICPSPNKFQIVQSLTYHIFVDELQSALLSTQQQAEQAPSSALEADPHLLTTTTAGAMSIHMTRQRACGEASKTVPLSLRNVQEASRGPLVIPDSMEANNIQYNFAFSTVTTAQQSISGSAPAGACSQDNTKQLCTRLDLSALRADLNSLTTNETSHEASLQGSERQISEGINQHQLGAVGSAQEIFVERGSSPKKTNKFFANKRADKAAWKALGTEGSSGDLLGMPPKRTVTAGDARVATVGVGKLNDRHDGPQHLMTKRTAAGKVNKDNVQAPQLHVTNRPPAALVGDHKHTVYHTHTARPPPRSASRGGHSLVKLPADA